MKYSKAMLLVTLTLASSAMGKSDAENLAAANSAAFFGPKRQDPAALAASQQARQAAEQAQVELGKLQQARVKAEQELQSALAKTSEAFERARNLVVAKAEQGDAPKALQEVEAFLSSAQVIRGGDYSPPNGLEGVQAQKQLLDESLSPLLTKMETLITRAQIVPNNKKALTDDEIQRNYTGAGGIGILGAFVDSSPVSAAAEGEPAH